MMKVYYLFLLFLLQVIGIQIKVVVAFSSLEPSSTTASSSSPSMTPAIQKKISKAIQLTTLSTNDIDKAYQVCEIWNDLLSSPSSSQTQNNNMIPPKILAICYALQGSCLARIGQDILAIHAFDSCLQLKHLATPQTLYDARIGKASCLQRLMMYDEARSMFVQCATDDGRLVQVKPNNSKDQNNVDEEYLKKYEKAVCSAVTCSLRMGDFDWAYKYLSSQEEIMKHRRQNQHPNNTSSVTTATMYEVKGMFGILSYLCQPNDDKPLSTSSLTEILKLLECSTSQSSSSSPLYRWVYNILVQRYHESLLLSSKSYTPLPMNDMISSIENNNYLPFSDINVSPFDDPDLIQVDDKISLHQLLIGNNNNEYVPQGFILPQEKELMITTTTKTACSSDTYPNQNKNDYDKTPSSSSLPPILKEKKGWILKQRAGYGSHGNQLVSLSEAIKHASQDTSTLSSSSFLCQRMVDPPLLLNNRKFTLRIYVVYFMYDNHDETYNENTDSINSNVQQSQPYLYISRIGLVKLASVPYCNDSNDMQKEENSIHMTNSGRETSMLQYELEFLRRYFEKEGWSYDELWENICNSVKQVMHTYQEQKDDFSPSSLLMSAKSHNGKSEKSFNHHHQQQQRPRRRLASLGIPKILGFDYMLDSKQKPWLLEVNRFPGLEARDKSDELVKRQVVQDAWSLASERLNLCSGGTTAISSSSCTTKMDDTSLDMLL